MNRAMRIFLAAALVAPAIASAQSRGRAAGQCAVDTTAEWYKNQKSYYTPGGETWSDDTLRRALLAAAKFDPSSAFVPELGWRLTTPATSAPGADSTVFATLRAMSQRRQWPTRAMVGTAGVHAAWLVAQRDSALSLAAMRRMMEAGPGESSPAEVAVLDDARRVKIGRGQIHGTQFTKSGAGVTLAGKLEDSVHVEMRREGAWLPSLSVSACLAARAAAAP